MVTAPFVDNSTKGAVTKKTTDRASAGPRVVGHGGIEGTANRGSCAHRLWRRQNAAAWFDKAERKATRRALRNSSTNVLITSS